MVTEAETVLTTVSGVVRRLLAYLFDLSIIYLVLSLVFGLLEGRYWLDYTIVRGVCFSCREEMFGGIIFVLQFGVVLVGLVVFTLYVLACESAVEGTLGEKLMGISFSGLGGDGRQPITSWFCRTSWITVALVIPFGYKVILLLVTMVILFYNSRSVHSRS